MNNREDALNVWSERQLVGRLWRNLQGMIGFRYEPDWCQQGFAISHTLPLQAAAFEPETGQAHRFFANLLPEGGARTQLVRDLKISDTDFDLLRAIGGECAGALSLLPVEETASVEFEYHRLTVEELDRLVLRRGIPMVDFRNERPRLSLAGAQNKCPVLVAEGAYWLPRNEAPSSHILKFELPDYRNLPAFETFTSLLAASVGLPTAEVALRSVNGRYFCEIGRYDRVQNQSGVLQRLHQEDFCQALGSGHERKYQEDGGPSFANCMQLVRQVSSDPAIDMQHLLDWQIFNVLAGNSDGHAKNLSLLYLPGQQVRLAPFYDLVCTRAIERIDSRLAMDVGGERNPYIVTSAHWEAQAKTCGLGQRLVKSRVANMIEKLQQHLQPTQAIFEEQFGDYPALQRVVQVVRKTCNTASRFL